MPHSGAKCVMHLIKIKCGFMGRAKRRMMLKAKGMSISAGKQHSREQTSWRLTSRPGACLQETLLAPQIPAVTEGGAGEGLETLFGCSPRFSSAMLDPQSNIGTRLKF
eukprot:1158762-Pelagomonas_calceolata.AAC.1